MAVGDLWHLPDNAFVQKT